MNPAQQAVALANIRSRIADWTASPTRGARIPGVESVEYVNQHREFFDLHRQAYNYRPDYQDRLEPLLSDARSNRNFIESALYRAIFPNSGPPVTYGGRNIENIPLTAGILDMMDEYPDDSPNDLLEDLESIHNARLTGSGFIPRERFEELRGDIELRGQNEELYRQMVNRRRKRVLQNITEKKNRK
jgi:hypothetical protein